MEILKINLAALKKASWSAEETQNVTLITDFVQHLMNNHDFDYVQEKYNNGLYLQHNRNITNGIAGVIDTVKNFAKTYPEYTYDVKHIYADGNYVIFHSHATIKKKHRGDDTKGLNIIDTWKIENGKIVEHWDAIQPLDFSMRLFVLLNGGKIRNSNGVY